MTIKLLVCAMAMSAATALHAAPRVLPDACGDANVKFHIRITKHPYAPAVPGSGKARIVFIETYLERGNVVGFPTARFGIDGDWVGATRGNSFFTVSVAPGEHHLCAVRNKDVGVRSFTAEAGKVYYYEAAATAGYTPDLTNPGGGGRGMLPQMPTVTSVDGFTFSPLAEDEAMRRLNVSELSSSRPRN